MTNNALVIREQCPRCKNLGKDRSKDNLAIYSDGHKYCYSCGYYIPPSWYKRLTNLTNSKNDDIMLPSIIGLPGDAQKEISVKAIQWLGQYGIMRSEIEQNRLKWSPSRNFLLFPFYGDIAADKVNSPDNKGSLIAWTARDFSINPKTKWYSIGPFYDLLNIIGLQKETKDVIIVVEDPVSCIKVGRHVPCLALFGSVMDYIRFNRLKHITEHLVIWLDKDKVKDSYRIAEQAKLHGFKTGNIISELDPKCYSNEQILEFVTEVI